MISAPLLCSLHSFVKSVIYLCFTKLTCFLCFNKIVIFNDIRPLSTIAKDIINKNANHVQRNYILYRHNQTMLLKCTNNNNNIVFVVNILKLLTFFGFTFI